MNVDVMNTLMNEAIILLLICSLPSIGLGLLIGFMVSLFQALTQIQEQTLTFVPKMIVVMLMIGLTSSWIASQMISFCERLWTMIPTLVR
jgi:flagellar biosynthetic protein FliQ